MNFIFGLVIAAILIIKYSKGKNVKPLVAILIVAGLGVSIFGGFLGGIIGGQGGAITGSIFRLLAGSALVAGLFIELVGSLEVVAKELDSD